MNLGPLEIGGILLLFVLLFGAKKLPDLGSSLGKSIKNFKKGLNEPADDDDEKTATGTTAETEVPPATQTSRHDT
jgi:sec-independent protein translocase protein TatA